MKTALAAVVAVAIPLGGASAFFEPPVKGPLDAACRQEARSRVFSAPDPDGVGLYEVGKRIYLSCMAASSRQAQAGPTHR